MVGNHRPGGTLWMWLGLLSIVMLFLCFLLQQVWILWRDFSDYTKFWNTAAANWLWGGYVAISSAIPPCLSAGSGWHAWKHFFVETIKSAVWVMDQDWVLCENPVLWQLALQLPKEEINLSSLGRGRGIYPMDRGWRATYGSISISSFFSGLFQKIVPSLPVGMLHQSAAIPWNDDWTVLDFQRCWP